MNTASPFAIRKTRFQLPLITGMMERRILTNFRCRPDVLVRLLPSPFRPKLIHGWGMAGICLVRLGQLRPAFFPFGGLRSENAAHRIAVEWDDCGETREGVFIPRRDSNALFNRIAGGKLFPGFHHAATFNVSETDNRFEVEMRSEDGASHVCVHARVANQSPADSIFRSLDEASAFFQTGALGWSSRPREKKFDGLELSCDEWRMEPLVVERVESSFFENADLFPPGSAQFDSAFLMRNIAHEWHARGRLAVRTETL